MSKLSEGGTVIIFIHLFKLICLKYFQNLKKDGYDIILFVISYFIFKLY